MVLFLTINTVASLIAFAGLTYAMFSKHVLDGILIKKGLAAAAFGFAANAVHPTIHSQLWIACSFAALVLFVCIRILEARIKREKPVFLVF